MNPKEEKELYELIRNLSKGIKRHGIRKIIKALKQISISDEDEFNNSIIDAIEVSVCAKIGVPRDELYGFATRGEITIARKICILLIRKFIPDIGDELVGNHYNRSRQVVHNTEKEFRSLHVGKQNKFHEEYINLHNELQAELYLYMEELKKPNTHD
jgi:hypothetical protein